MFEFFKKNRRNKSEAEKDPLTDPDTEVECEEEVVCGGTSSNFDDKAPTAIESDDMYLFNVSSSFRTLVSMDGDDISLDYIYAYAAGTENGFLVNISKTLRTGESHYFNAIIEDNPFPELVSFVKEFNIAASNGRSSFTHGLPENFGGTISVKYKSGEKIWISNNQSPVLMMEAGKKISDIYDALEECPKVELKRADDIKKIFFKDYKNEKDYQYCTLEILDDGSGKSTFEIKLEEYDPSSRVSNVPAEKISKIKETVDRSCMLGWPGLPENDVAVRISGRIKTLTFTFSDGSEITVKDDYELPDGLGSAFFKIELEMK